MFKLFNNRTQILGVLLIVLCSTLYCSIEAQQQRRFCGTMLTEAFTMYCKYGMPSKLEKKSVVTSADGFDNYELPILSYLDASSSNSMLRLRRNYGTVRKIGAYDECCLKGCSTHELLEYCVKAPTKDDSSKNLPKPEDSFNNFMSNLSD